MCVFGCSAQKRYIPSIFGPDRAAHLIYAGGHRTPSEPIVPPCAPRRTWLKAELGPEAVSKHMVAVSTNLKLVKEFGIDTEVRWKRGE